MDAKSFNNVFLYYFPVAEQNQPTAAFESAFSRSFFDSCFDIQGMTSIKKQKLLNIAFSMLPENECYVEVGTHQGKSLVSAMRGNAKRPAYACDNFSEFANSRTREYLMRNLARYGLAESVTFHDGDFKGFFASEIIQHKIGVYFYDGAHDLESHYNGIVCAEPKLADEAVVIVDDWRWAADSTSYAEAGTRKAIAESKNQWQLLYVLPARYNGDHGLWWNAVAVFAFRRR